MQFDLRRPTRLFGQTEQLRSPGGTRALSLGRASRSSDARTRREPGRAGGGCLAGSGTVSLRGKRDPASFWLPFQFPRCPPPRAGGSGAPRANERQ
jgi:hypothetical protein